MTNTKFYATRTIAQAAAKASTGLKFADKGADQAKGKRWATYSVSSKTPSVSQSTSSTNNVVKKIKAVKAIKRMMNGGKTRQQILAHLVAKCDMTAPGASTYYANVKRNAAGW